MQFLLLVAILLLTSSINVYSQFTAHPTDFESPVSNQFSWHNKLWISTANNGLYASEDNASTWLNNWKLNHEGNVNRLENGGILKVNKVIPYQNQLFGCTDHGLYMSLDEGKNWSLIINFQQSDPNYGNVVDVSVIHIAFSLNKAIVTLANGTIATSSTGGSTWSTPFKIAEAVSDSPNRTPRQYITWSDNKWYLLTAKRLLVSTDEAQSWQSLPLSIGTNTATIVDVQQNNIVVGASDDVFNSSGSFTGKKVSLFISRNDGQTWNQSDFVYQSYNGIYTPVDVNVSSVDNRFYASAMGDVWFTTSASSTWASCRSGIPPKAVSSNSIAVQANLLVNNGRLYTLIVEPSSTSQYLFFYRLYSRALEELEPNYLEAPVLTTVKELTSFYNSISWQDVSGGEASFDIERSDQTLNSFQLIGHVDATVASFLDKQVQAGIAYYYRIRAKKGSEYSAYSTVAKSIRPIDCTQINTLTVVRRVEQPSPTVLYALSGSELIKSLDGGKQWQVLDICDANNDIYADLSFQTPDLGFAITRSRPNLFKTVDGGKTWKRILPKISNPNLESFSVHFVNDSIGYMVAKLSGFGPYYTLYKTTNGGYSFDALQNSPELMLDDYGLYLSQKLKPSFIGNSTIVGLTVVRSNSALDRLVISTDGGVTWQKRLIPDQATSASRLYAVSANDIWLFGRTTGRYSDDVFHTIDGGNSWTKISLPDRVDDPYRPITLSDIRFTDSQRGMIIGGKNGGSPEAIGYIYSTSNGGANWESVSTGTSVNTQLTVLSIRGEQVIAFGDGKNYSLNQINRTDRLVLTSANMGTRWERNCDLDNITPYSIAFRTPKDVYMAGQSQLLRSGTSDATYVRTNYYHKSTDGGICWLKGYLPADEQLFEVYFLNATTGFLTTQNAVWITVDGGQTWGRKSASGSFLPLRVYNDGNIHYAEKFRKSYFVSEQVWFRISTTNQVFKTSDGGNSWVQLATPSFTDTPLFSFINSQSGFCTGEEGNKKGQVYKTTDGGQTWSLIGQGSRIGSVVTDLVFVDELTGFINDAVPHITRDGGKTWNSIPNIYNDVSYRSAFSFVNKTTGYLGGLYKTTDGGDTWVKLPNGQLTVSPITVLDENTAYGLNTSIRHGSPPCNLVSYTGDSLVCNSPGQPATIQIVTGSVSNPLRYQWYKLPENTPVAGETSATLSMTALSVYDIQSFYCVVTNGCGMSKSDKFTVLGERVVFTLKNGNWSDLSVWSCSRIPTSNDRVVLKHDVTVSAAYKAYAYRLDFFDNNARLRYNGQAALKFGTL